VKVIMATNRIDVLDPALIRPGRIDRKIYFPYPDAKTLKKILSIQMKNMKTNGKIDLDEIVSGKEELTGADMKAICQEAGMTALRKRKRGPAMEDFVTAKEKTLKYIALLVYFPSST